MYYFEYKNEAQTSIMYDFTTKFIYIFMNLFSWKLRYVNFVREYFEA